MLGTATPFPEQGSYALLDDGDREVPVRITSRRPDGNVTVALHGGKVASTNRTVDLDELRPLTPLDEAERSEMEMLQRWIKAGDGTPDIRARLAALDHRDRFGMAAEQAA